MRGISLRSMLLALLVSTAPMYRPTPGGISEEASSAIGRIWKTFEGRAGRQALERPLNLTDDLDESLRLAYRTLNKVDASDDVIQEAALEVCALRQTDHESWK